MTDLPADVAALIERLKAERDASGRYSSEGRGLTGTRRFQGLLDDTIAALTRHAKPVHWIEGEPPKNGAIHAAVFQVPVRWQRYKPSAPQVQRGTPGRWQMMNEYGGWENAPGAGRQWAFAGYFEDAE